MDSNRKARLERTRTPVHLNASEYQFKSSASKRYSPNVTRRPNLNETLNCKIGSTDPKIKSKFSVSYAINYETECDIAYNDYLQALLRSQLVKKQLAQQKEILEGQLVVQEEASSKRSAKLEKIVRDTETFEKQRDIIEIVDFLQENINDLTNIYIAYDVKNILNNFEEILNSECDTVVLKHIRPLKNQQEYDKFINNMQLCNSLVKKINNSGRDFENVHVVAEQIRDFIKVKEVTDKLQENISDIQKDAVYTFLRNASDFFAMKYNNEMSELDLQ